MKSLRFFAVSFLSVVLAFSFGPVSAQDLVDTVPDLYYLEDAVDDTVTVHACYRLPSENTDSSVSSFVTAGFHCSEVAEVSLSDLDRLLTNSSSEVQRTLDESSYSRGLHWLSAGSTSLGIAVGFLGFAAMASSKIYYILPALKGLVIGAVGVNGLAHFEHILVEHQDVVGTDRTLGEQIRAGVVGESSAYREQILKQFTDFINEYGVRPNSTTATVAQN